MPGEALQAEKNAPPGKTQRHGAPRQECRGVVGAVEAGKIWALCYVRGLGFQFRAMQHKQRFLKYGKVPAVAPFKTE